MFIALEPNLKVVKDSYSLYVLAEQQIIMQVFALPPKDSYKIRVSFEFLYGIY